MSRSISKINLLLHNIFFKFNGLIKYLTSYLFKNHHGKDFHLLIIKVLNVNILGFIIANKITQQTYFRDLHCTVAYI